MLANPAKQPAKGSEQQADTLFAKLGQQKHKRQGRQNGEHAKLEVVAAAQEMVPRPNVLRQGHGDQRDSGGCQQQTANESIHSCSECKCIQTWPCRCGSVIQEFFPVHSNRLVNLPCIAARSLEMLSSPMRFVVSELFAQDPDSSSGLAATVIIGDLECFSYMNQTKCP